MPNVLLGGRPESANVAWVDIKVRARLDLVTDRIFALLLRHSGEPPGAKLSNCRLDGFSLRSRRLFFVSGLRPLKCFDNRLRQKMDAYP